MHRKYRKETIKAVLSRPKENVFLNKFSQEQPISGKTTFLMQKPTELGIPETPVLKVFFPSGGEQGILNRCFVFCQEVNWFITVTHKNDENRKKEAWKLTFGNDTDKFFNYIDYKSAEWAIQHHSRSEIENIAIFEPVKLENNSWSSMLSPTNITCKPAHIIVRDLFNFLFYRLNVFRYIQDRYIHTIREYVGEFIDKFVDVDRGMYCISSVKMEEFLHRGTCLFASRLENKESKRTLDLPDKNENVLPSVIAKRLVMSMIKPRTLKYYETTIDEFMERKASIEKLKPGNGAFVAFIREYAPLCILLHSQNACDTVGQCALRFLPSLDDETKFCDETEEEFEKRINTKPAETIEKQCSDSITVESVKANKKKSKKKKTKAPKNVIESSKTDEPTQHIESNKEDINLSTSAVEKPNQPTETAIVPEAKGVNIATQTGTPLYVLTDQEKKKNMEIAAKTKEIERLEKLVIEKDKQMKTLKLESEKKEKKCTKEVSDLRKKMEDQQKNHMQGERNKEKKLADMRRTMEEKDRIIKEIIEQAKMKEEEQKMNQKEAEKMMKQKFERELAELRDQLNNKDIIIEENKQQKKAMDKLEQKIKSNMPSTSTGRQPFGGKKPADYFKAYIEEGKSLIVTAKQALDELMLNSDVNTERKRAQVEFDYFQRTMSFYTQEAKRNLALLKAEKDAESDQLLVKIPEIPCPFSELTHTKMEEAREQKYKEKNPECGICFDPLHNGSELWACGKCTFKCHYEGWKKHEKKNSATCPQCRDDKNFPELSTNRR